MHSTICKSFRDWFDVNRSIRLGLTKMCVKNDVYVCFRSQCPFDFKFALSVICVSAKFEISTPFRF